MCLWSHSSGYMGDSPEGLRASSRIDALALDLPKIRALTSPDSWTSKLGLVVKYSSE